MKIAKVKILGCGQSAGRVIMNLPQRLENFTGTLGEQVLLGSVVGDGHLIKRTRSTEIQLAHCERQKDYLLWKVRLLEQSGIEFYSYECLYGLDGKGRIKYCEKNSNIIPKYKEIFYHSRSYVELNDYFRMFYRGKQKIVRRKVLNNFKPLALAIWFQDDGNLNGQSNMLRLSTHCFSEKENKMLSRYFKTVWHVTSRVLETKEEYFGLSFGVESTKRLIETIRPYFHPSMEYKIELTPKISLEERDRRFIEGGISYRFEKGQRQPNSGRTWFKKEHPYFPKKNSHNGNQAFSQKLDDIV